MAWGWKNTGLLISNWELRGLFANMWLQKSRSDVPHCEEQVACFVATESATGQFLGQPLSYPSTYKMFLSLRPVECLNLVQEKWQITKIRFFLFSSKFFSLKADLSWSAKIFKARLIGFIFPLSGIHIVSPTVKEVVQTVGWEAWQSYNYTTGDIKHRKNW